MAGETTPADETRRRRGRRLLLILGLFALVALAGPWLVRAWIARDLCPTVVTKSGDADGTRWEIARSDCGDGRIVHQLRIVPPKGYSTLVYETEGGSLPLGWTQSGFVGKLELDHPLVGESDVVLDVPLDPKGRPKTVLHVRAGKRVSTP